MCPELQRWRLNYDQWRKARIEIMISNAMLNICIGQCALRSYAKHNLRSRGVSLSIILTPTMQFWTHILNWLGIYWSLGIWNKIKALRKSDLMILGGNPKHINVDVIVFITWIFHLFQPKNTRTNLMPCFVKYFDRQGFVPGMPVSWNDMKMLIFHVS